jgi:ABC-type transport system substrate-binding protein
MVRRFAIAVAAVTLLAGACTDPGITEALPPDSTAPVTTTMPPVPVTITTVPPASPTVLEARNEIVVGIDEPLVTLNPFSLEATSATFTVAEAHMAGAYDVAPDLQLVPSLVIELPTRANGGVAVVEEGLSVGWTIDPQATWSDGVPVTGHDFLFTWDAMIAVIGRQQSRDVLERFGPDAELSGDHPYGWGSPGSVADTDAVAAYRELLYELRRTIDAQRFDDITDRMVQIVADEVVIIPLASRPATVAWRAELEGPVGHADPRLFTWNVERWCRAPD